MVIAAWRWRPSAGFVVAVMPGGLGVREGVLMSALAPALGPDRSVVAALCCGWSGWPPSWPPRRSWSRCSGAAREPVTNLPWKSRLAEPVMIRISVVVPVHNEEESLAALHGELAAVFADGAHGPAEFIFVDDGSRDGSWQVLAELAAERPARRRDPVPPQLRQGRRADGRLPGRARRDRLHARRRPPGRPRRDPPLPRPSSTSGFDVVSGWKKTRHDPWHKVYPSRVFNWMVSALTGCHLHDHNCGFKLYRREVLDEVGIYGELHRFIPVLAHARGFRVGEVVVQHRPRQHRRRRSTASTRLLKGFLDLLTVRFLTRFSQRPLHVLGGIGLVLLVIGGLGMLYLAIVWLDPTNRPIGNRPLLFYSGGLREHRHPAPEPGHPRRAGHRLQYPARGHVQRRRAIPTREDARPPPASHRGPAWTSRRSLALPRRNLREDRGMKPTNDELRCRRPPATPRRFVALIVITAATAIADGPHPAPAGVHDGQRHLPMVHRLEPARARHLRHRRVPLAGRHPGQGRAAPKRGQPGPGQPGQALLFEQARADLDADRGDALPGAADHAACRSIGSSSRSGPSAGPRSPTPTIRASSSGVLETPKDPVKWPAYVFYFKPALIVLQRRSPSGSS